jgi:type III secretory pathway component EscR
MPFGKHNQGGCKMTATILGIILAVVIILPILLWVTDRLTTNKIEFESIEEFEKFQRAFKGKNK